MSQSQSISEGTQGRNLEAGTDAESMACSACFLRHSMTACLGVAPPTVGWASHINP